MKGARPNALRDTEMFKAALCPGVNIRLLCVLPF